MRWLNGNINSMYMSSGELREIVKDREAWHAGMDSQRVGHDLATEQQQQCILITQSLCCTPETNKTL